LRVFKLTVLQIFVVIALSYIYNLAFQPIGQTLEGNWGKTKVPFLLETSDKVILERNVNIAGDIFTIPQIYARYIEISIDERIYYKMGRKDIDSILSEPIYFHVPRGRHLIRIVLYPAYGIVGITTTPFIVTSDNSMPKIFFLRFFGSYINVLSVTLPILLFIMFFILSEEISDPVRKKSYKALSFSLLMVGLSILDFVPIHAALSHAFSTMFAVLTTISAFSSPVLFIFSLEEDPSKKYTKMIGLISIGLLALSLVFRHSYQRYLIVLLLIIITTFFAHKLDERYFYPLIFYALVVAHDVITLLFSHGFPQLIPIGTLVFSISVAAVMAQDYGRIGRELEKTNEELTALNEELMAANEELEAIYKEQEITITKLENLIKLTSNIIKGSYDFENEEGFLRELLERAMEMIPEADYGSIAIVDGNKWNFIHTIGHDIDKLKDIDFEKSDFIDLRKYKYVKEFGAGVYLVNNIRDNTKSGMGKAKRERFENATLPTSKSLISQLRAGGEFLGHLSVDISKESEKSFSNDSIKIFSALGNIASAFIAFKKFSEMRSKFQKEIILAIIHIVEMHDPYTKGHSESVAKLSMKIASKMKIPEKDLQKVYWAGLVHDIGKLLVPAEILRKQENLTDEEYEIIKKHPIWGYEVLIYSEQLRDIAVYTRHHHERFDGTGYPDKLKGDSIPLISRIIAVADTWDAMRSDRSYRKALPVKVAMEELKKASGTQLDPDIVKIFLEEIVKKEMM